MGRPLFSMHQHLLGCEEEIYLQIYFHTPCELSTIFEYTSNEPSPSTYDATLIVVNVASAQNCRPSSDRKNVMAASRTFQLASTSFEDETWECIPVLPLIDIQKIVFCRSINKYGSQSVCALYEFSKQHIICLFIIFTYLNKILKHMYIILLKYFLRSFWRCTRYICIFRNLFKGQL